MGGGGVKLESWRWTNPPSITPPPVPLFQAAGSGSAGGCLRRSSGGGEGSCGGEAGWVQVREGWWVHVGGVQVGGGFSGRGFSGGREAKQQRLGGLRGNKGAKVRG